MKKIANVKGLEADLFYRFSSFVINAMQTQFVVSDDQKQTHCRAAETFLTKCL